MLTVGLSSDGALARDVIRAIARGGFTDLFAISAVCSNLNANDFCRLLCIDDSATPAPMDCHEVDGNVELAGQTIRIVTPSDSAGDELDIDLLLDTRSGETAFSLTDGGPFIAKKRIVAGFPASADLTAIFGVNEEAYDPDAHHVISAGSPALTATAPLLKLVNDAFSIRYGSVTVTGGGPVLTFASPRPGSSDLRVLRSFQRNLIPLPAWDSGELPGEPHQYLGAVAGHVLAIPVATPASIEVYLTLEKEVSVGAIVDAVGAGSATEAFSGIVQLATGEGVSSDYGGNPASVIVDGPCVQRIGDRAVRIQAWTDVDWSYACRLVDLTAMVCESGIPGTA